MKLNLKTTCFLSALGLLIYVLYQYIVVYVLRYASICGSWLAMLCVLLGLSGFFVGMYHFHQQMPKNNLWLRLLTLVSLGVMAVLFFKLNDFYPHCDSWYLFVRFGWWYLCVCATVMAVYIAAMGFMCKDAEISIRLKKYNIIASVIILVALIAVIVGYCDTTYYHDFLRWPLRIGYNIARLSMIGTFMFFLVIYYLDQLRNNQAERTIIPSKKLHPWMRQLAKWGGIVTLVSFVLVLILVFLQESRGLSEITLVISTLLFFLIYIVTWLGSLLTVLKRTPHTRLLRVFNWVVLLMLAAIVILVVLMHTLPIESFWLSDATFIGVVTLPTIQLYINIAYIITSEKS